MSHPALTARWRQADPTQLAASSSLARYRGDTLRAYTQDLRIFSGWCADRDLEPLRAQRPHLELYLRWLEQRGLAPATLGRRFTTVAGFFRYAVIDGHCDKDPSLAVTRPRVPWEGRSRTVRRPAPRRSAAVMG
jgi:site-specific recombinase XerD